MNKLIEEQLKKIQVAKVSSKDGDTFHFNKYIEFVFQVNTQYILKLDDSLLDREKNKVLIDNWNQGVIPTAKCYLVNVNQVMNNMIKVSGIKYNILDNTKDEQDMFTGWLPIDKVEVVK